MKAILILALLSFIEPKTIGYRQLNWSDFKGKPDSRGIALTTSQINFESTCNGDKCTFSVYSQFIPEKSFTTTTKERILAHEQLHFDITELMVRKLRGLLVGVDSQSKANEIYHQVVKDWWKLEQQYDTETNYSIDQMQQAIWETKIKLQLK